MPLKRVRVLPLLNIPNLKIYIMEQLEEQIQQKESAFIATVEGILKQSGSNRTKAALINKHYIKLLVATDDLVSAAKLETPPAGEAGAASSN